MEKEEPRINLRNLHGNNMVKLLHIPPAILLVLLYCHSGVPSAPELLSA